MLLRASAFAALLFFLGSVMGCGASESTLIVHVQGELTDAMKSLRVLTMFAGRPGQTSVFDPVPSEFRVVVPAGQAGDVVLEGMAKAKDDGCYVAGALVSAHFGEDTQVQHVDLSLIPYKQKSCSRICSPDGWCWTNPTPQGNELRKVWGDRPDNYWAVGYAGTILRWYGEEEGWRAVSSGVSTTLFGVWGSDSGSVWAVGDAWTVLFWNGSAWTQEPSVKPSGQGRLYSVWGRSDKDIWAVGANGLILHSDGTSWDTQQSFSNMTDLRAVWGNDSEVWAVGGKEGSTGAVLHKRNTEGSLWAPEESGAQNLLRDVWGSGTDIWAVGQKGTGATDTATILHRGTDGKWSPELSMLMRHLHGVWGDGQGTVWAVSDGAILARRDGTWTVATNPQDTLLGIGGVRSDDAWAVGGRGSMQRWSSSWNEQRSGSVAELASVSGRDDGKIWAVGERGTVLRCTDEGCSVDKVAEVNLSGIWVNGPGDAVAVGEAGRILRLTGADRLTADTLASPTTSWLRKVWANGPYDFWAVGDNSTAIHYQNGSFTSASWGLPTIHLRGVWSNGIEALAVGADDSNIDTDRFGFMVSGSGTRWSVDGWTTSLPLHGVWGSAANDVWAVGDGGRLLQWNSATWWQRIVSTSNLRAIWGIGANDLWMVGDSGTILRAPRTAGQAESFSSGTINRLYGVWASTTEDVWAVGSGGTILHYKR